MSNAAKNFDNLATSST